ncbi:MAG: hypothetical protein MZV70_07855 [Desulfobacterales bacterium]|nr:hypothetical protein [Desulfobacterales bacterium]
MAPTARPVCGSTATCGLAGFLWRRVRGQREGGDRKGGDRDKRGSQFVSSWGSPANVSQTPVA